MMPLRLLVVLLALVGQLENGRAQDGFPKRGLGVTDNAMKAIAALNVSWCYNWTPDAPENLPHGIEFVPMIWGWDSATGASAINKLTAEYRDKKFATLLGFNEPDGTLKKGGCAMSVEDALAAWPELMKVGARLGSPAAVQADGKWMRDFMAGAEEKKLRVDFITVHWYGSPDADALMATLERIHKLYHRPVWVTEFAPAAWDIKPGSSSHIRPAMVLAFMQKLFPAIQSTPFIERYAWFSSSLQDANMGTSGLFREDGTLTDCGRLYARGGIKPSL